jgi:hypothetical protein
MELVPSQRWGEPIENGGSFFSQFERFVVTLLPVGGAPSLSWDGTDAEPLASLVEIVQRRYRMTLVIPKASWVDRKAGQFSVLATQGVSK